VTVDPGREAGLTAAAAAFGRWLSQERELRGLERDEVARLSKLGSAIVSSLESGDPDRMPPKAYVFGYLRSYANVVGLDADDVVLRWQEVAGAEDTRDRRRRRPGPGFVVGLAIAAAVGVLVVVTLLGGPRERAPLKLDRPRAVQRAPYGSEPYGREPPSALRR
jgi:transcriptional regulator with XRE-family HTH domain